MVRKTVLLLSFFPLTLVLLLLNLTLLYNNSQILAYNKPYSTTPPVEVSFQLASPGGTSQILDSSVTAGDSRSLLVESFLRRYDSPMAPYAGIIVAEADRFDVDFRLVPAIAMCESNGGKRMPKKNEYNFAGIAVYTGTNVGAAFTNWPHAIAWVTRYIREHYYNRNITDLRDIGAIWAPPSVNTGYSWTSCVEQFYNKII